ncbi:hypothetical protein ACIBL5_06195 [Streptomyces sp. NPDC050516]|uniref:hypothetical protein n=1 Tax=Streptomyces sp. NPDC050516 TaxID=3365621 RepID=UPI003788AA75
MTVKRALPALSAVRETVSRAHGLLLVFALSACSSQDKATSPQEVRTLAGSPQAQLSRKIAEDRMRGIVNAYAKDTPLALGLVAIHDVCAGGKAKELLFQTGDDEYKIRCNLQITAYYGADLHRIADVLDGILAAGDHYSSDGNPDPYATIPFHRQNGRSSLVDYYRGIGPNPNSPNTSEPTNMFAIGQHLSWDTVRSSQKTLISESNTCLDNDPPVVRCLSEPASTTVADIRKQHGMVFKLELLAVLYYTVYKDGKIAPLK